jgi:hypothetical protein
MPTFVPTWQDWKPQKSAHIPFEGSAQSAKRERADQPVSTNPPSGGSAQTANPPPSTIPRCSDGGAISPRPTSVALSVG